MHSQLKGLVWIFSDILGLPLFKETRQVGNILSYLFKSTWLAFRGASEVEESPRAISRKKAFLWSCASAYSVITLCSAPTLSNSLQLGLFWLEVCFLYSQRQTKEGWTTMTKLNKYDITMWWHLPSMPGEKTKKLKGSLRIVIQHCLLTILN